MNKRDVLKKIRLHLKKYGYKLTFDKKDYVEHCGLKCAGVFRHSDKELVVARSNPLWFEVTLHEYCHFLQQVEKCEEWKMFDKYSGSWWGWLCGASIKNKKDCFRAVRNIELDCERRVMDMIKKYKMPIDTEKYARRANAMMFKYKYLDSTRKRGQLSHHKAVIFRNMMPKEMLVSADYDRLPPEYKKFLDKHLKTLDIPQPEYNKFFKKILDKHLKKKRSLLY